jgi:HEAT repeat protein
VAVLFVATGLCACSSPKPGSWFERRKSSREWLELALEARNPDDRRRGVIGLANGRDATTGWAIKVFDVVARTDTDAMVRCAAVRAMPASAEADHVPTLLKLLKSARDPVEGCRPAAGMVRWEAAKALRAIAEAEAYDVSHREAIIETLLEVLSKEEERNVKLTAINTLEHFAQRPVPIALINAMEADDFSIKHAAEQSLITLTGTTHHHDPAAWRFWLASTEDPFARAGTMPPEAMQAKSKPRWEWPWEW